MTISSIRKNKFECSRYGVGLTYSVDARLRQIPLIAGTVEFTLFLCRKHQGMEDEEMHIGNIIRSKLKEEERSNAWLARHLHTDSSNISKILKKKHLDTDLLLQISTALQYDFFALYSKQIAKFAAKNALL